MRSWLGLQVPIYHGQCTSAVSLQAGPTVRSSPRFAALRSAITSSILEDFQTAREVSVKVGDGRTAGSAGCQCVCDAIQGRTPSIKLRGAGAQIMHCAGMPHDSCRMSHLPRLHERRSSSRTAKCGSLAAPGTQPPLQPATTTSCASGESCASPSAHSCQQQDGCSSLRSAAPQQLAGSTLRPLTTSLLWLRIWRCRRDLGMQKRWREQLDKMKTALAAGCLQVGLHSACH
jgi:hypothetical protein